VNWFANCKIRSKLLLSLLPLGLIVIGALLVASMEMESLDARYTELLDSKVKAVMAIIRATQRTVQINQQLYELIAESDADNLIRLDGDIERTIRKYHEHMAEAKKASPPDAPAILKIEQLFDKFTLEANLVRAKTQKNTDNEALVLMRERVKPLFAQARAGSSKLADSMLDMLEKASTSAMASTKVAIRFTWLAALVGLILSLAMALFIAQVGVVRPLQHLRDSIRDVAAGRHGREVHYQELTNEIGEIARDLCILQRGVFERDVQARVKEELAGLAESLQTARDYQTLAGALFTRLADNAAIIRGELFVAKAEGDRFARVGGFAVDDPETPTEVALGEGLVGQCALDSRPIELSADLAASGLGVRTGLGTLVPGQLLVLPVVHQHKAIAVLALAFGSPVEENERALLEAMLQIVALNLEILSGNLATQRLLEQTKLQAESLAVSETQLLARKDQLQSALGEVEAVKAQLVEMTDSLPVGVYQVVTPSDGQGRFTFASRRTEAILGVRPADLLADPDTFWRHVHPDDIAKGKVRIAAAIGRARAGATVSRGEFVLRLHLDGQDRFILTNAQYKPMEDGSIEANGFFQDITERMRAENDALRAQAEMTQIFNTAGGGMWVLGQDCSVLKVNDAFLELSGYAREEVEGKNCHEVFGGADCAAETCARQRIMAGEKKVEAGVRRRRKDGREIACDLTATPLFAPGGELLGIIEDFRDVTEREAAAEAMEQARVLAEEANKAKSDFLARMSHEIRTPMNAVIGMSHLALQTELTAKQHDYISKIQASANNLLGIINDILDFSKIEAGKMDVEHIPFDLDETLDNAASVIAVKAEEKGLEVIFDMARDIPRHLVGDPLRLNQVLINYANNAIKFTESGHVLLSARLEERCADDQVRIRFAVTDTGVGLTEDQIGRIFQSFSQADGSITRKYGGTGLGLTICKRLANLMGGEVGVESKPGQGSTFWFTVLLGVSEADEAKPAYIPAVDLRRMRCLVVDDNPEMRRILADILESFSFRVESVADGESALAALAKAVPGDPFKLVLLDWKMPGLDGNAVARRIKDHPALNVSQILMVTAYGREEVMREAQDAGVSAFLVKPVGASTLFDTIMEVFGKQVEKKVRGPKTQAVDLAALAAIRGARVLLAEDNEINQQVATELLRQAGLVVDIADNGRQAFEAATTKPYDLVLMDIQMPEMDGLEATGRIRASGRPGSAELPIIAMTAHAMSGDREKSLAAGLNDHVTKPIDPEELVKALIRWIKPGERQAPVPETETTSSPEADDLPLAGLPGLAIKLGLSRMGGNRKLYRQLLTKFRGSQAQAASDIRRELEAGDGKAAARIAHTLRSVAGNIGAEDLSRVAGELERAIKAEATDSLSALLPDFEAKMAQAVSSIAELELLWRNGNGQPVKVSYDGDVFGAQLRELRDLLETDMGQAMALVEAFESLVLPPDCNATVERLKEAMSAFDTDEASAAIEILLAGLAAAPTEDGASP